MSADGGHLRSAYRPVIEWRGPICAALKYRQMPRLLGHDGDDLNGGGPGANDAYPLTGEIERSMRPVGGVE